MMPREETKIRCGCVVHNAHGYLAGPVTLYIAGIAAPAVASWKIDALGLVVDKWITTPDGAVDWLVSAGLPLAKARALVRDEGITDHREQTIRLNTHPIDW